jgi:hypothetical protein
VVGVLLGGLAFAAGVSVVRALDALPPSGVEAVVEGDAVEVPVGAPAVYAWLDVGVLVQGRGTHPQEQRVWQGGLGRLPDGSVGEATVRFRAGSRVVEVPAPSLAQFRYFDYENATGSTFADIGLPRFSQAPGPKGVYVHQIALRAGDTVTLVETSPVEIWRGGRAAVEARARDLGSSDRAFALIFFGFGACAWGVSAFLLSRGSGSTRGS